MNLLLLEPEQVAPDGVARIDGDALAHVIGVLGKGVGDSLVVGVRDGKIGSATITELSTGAAELKIALTRDPPPPSWAHLVLALPRPPMLRRIFGHAAAMGVKRIDLVGTARVDKSYWGTPSLHADKVGHQLRLGLSQAVDTVLPEVHCHRRFLPFVEDELPTLATGQRIVADIAPGAAPIRPATGPVTIVVGPEGGLVDFERERLADQGFTAVTLGPRVLRVETAVVAVLARLG